MTWARTDDDARVRYWLAAELDTAPPEEHAEIRRRIRRAQCPCSCRPCTRAWVDAQLAKKAAEK